MNVAISTANTEDLHLILDLQKECFKTEAIANNDFNIPPLKQDLESIKNEFEKGTILKATIDTEIVGSVRGYLNDQVAYVGKLIVHPNFQNKGIGKNLMESIEKEFEEAVRIEIFTGEKSVNNIHMYTKIGYKAFKKEEINENLTLVFLEKIK